MLATSVYQILIAFLHLKLGTFGGNGMDGLSLFSCYIIWLIFAIIAYLLVYSRNQREPAPKKRFILFWAGYRRESYLFAVVFVPVFAWVIVGWIWLWSAGNIPILYLIGVGPISAIQILALFFIPYLQKSKK
jgi:hypothetical protein